MVFAVRRLDTFNASIFLLQVLLKHLLLGLGFRFRVIVFWGGSSETQNDSPHSKDSVLINTELKTNLKDISFAF